MGNYTAAEPLYKEALAIYKKTLGENNPRSARTLNNLALLYQFQSRYAEALPLLTQAIDIKQEQVKQVFPVVSETQRKQFWDANSRIFNVFPSFMVKSSGLLPQTVGVCYNNLLFSKALLLRTGQRVKQNIMANPDTSLRRQYNEWQNQLRWLSKVYEMPTARRDSLGIDMEAIESHTRDLEAQLSRRSTLFAQVFDTTHYTWQHIQKALKPNEAAVEVVRFKWYSKKFTDTVYYALLVVTPQTQGQPQLIVLKNGNDLEGKYFKNYKGAIGPTEETKKYRTNDFDSYQYFWQPLDSVLKNTHTVYFSPDGVYHKINLQTLLTPAGKYLFEEKDIRLLGNTKDLLYAQTPQPSAHLTATLVGNPNYSLDTTQNAALSSQLLATIAERSSDAQFYGVDSLPQYQVRTLPQTQVEVANIDSLLQSKGYKTTVCTDNAALEEAVKKVHNPTVLHLATHGFFEPDVPFDKKAAQRQFYGIESNKATQNPLLRSGLLFAGAQNTLNQLRPQNAPYDNGILTAQEALQLHLDSTNLVVMSACETALGAVSNGEGVYGLQRALQAAGAKTLLMSLWKVDDEATQLLMTTFYTQWLQTGNKRQAFAAAQQALRVKFNHPYFWGAFVIIGE
jgi:CHAT domain-containing protein